MLLSINTIVQCSLKYEIPWLFLNLCRYRKINQIELLFRTATFYTYTAEVKSTHFAGIFFSHIHSSAHTNLYERYFKCICTYPCPMSILFFFSFFFFINTLHGHNGFHILTKEHQRGNKYQRQHVKETSQIQNNQYTPKHLLVQITGSQFALVQRFKLELYFFFFNIP